MKKTPLFTFLICFGTIAATLDHVNSRPKCGMMAFETITSAQISYTQVKAEFEIGGDRGSVHRLESKIDEIRDLMRKCDQLEQRRTFFSDDEHQVVSNLSIISSELKTFSAPKSSDTQKIDNDLRNVHHRARPYLHRLRQTRNPSYGPWVESHLQDIYDIATECKVKHLQASSDFEACILIFSKTGNEFIELLTKEVDLLK